MSETDKKKEDFRGPQSWADIVGTLEDIQKPKKQKKSKNRDSEDVVEDSLASEVLEDLQDPKNVKQKQKESKNRKDNDSEDAEKQKKSKHQNPEDFEAFEDDHQDSGDVENHKKSKDRDLEDVVEDPEASETPEIAPEDLQGLKIVKKKQKESKKRKEKDPEDIQEPKKHKKSKHQYSEYVAKDPEVPAVPADAQDLEDVKKKQKELKKWKDFYSKHIRKDFEVPECSEDFQDSEDVVEDPAAPATPADAQDLEDVKKKQKELKKWKDFYSKHIREDFKVPECSEDFQDSEDVVEDPAAPATPADAQDLEDVKKKQKELKKWKDFYSKHIREDFKVPECSEDFQDSEDAVEDPEASDALKNTPEDAQKKKAKRKMAGKVPPNMFFQYLRFLYKSIKPDAGNAFLADHFDWDVFRQLCETGGKPCPKFGSIKQSYYSIFYDANRDFFCYMNPTPSLRERMIFCYEALARFLTIKRPNNGEYTTTKYPNLNRKLMATVIYEHHVKNDPNWKPPSQIQRYLKNLDTENIKKRLETAREMQEREKQRKNEATASPLTVRTTRLKARSEGPPPRMVRFAEGDRSIREDLEISTILADNSAFSDPNLTLLNITASSSTSFRADETILAGGGRIVGKRANSLQIQQNSLEITGFESLRMPEVDETARKRVKLEKEAEKKFSLDDSFVNIWDQINQN